MRVKRWPAKVHTCGDAKETVRLQQSCSISTAAKEERKRRGGWGD